MAIDQEPGGTGGGAETGTDAGREAGGKPHGQSNSKVKVRAWDIPTRAFHWTLVVLLLSAYLTRHYGDIELFWHKVNGYAILILIVFRILWGFVGGSTARFLAFASWPWTAAQYLFDFLRNVPRHYLGHNPLGGWVIFAMLAALSFQGVSGLFSNDDALAEGPFVSLVTSEQSAQWTSWHLWTFDIILVLIVMHIAANFVYLFWKKDNLIVPMVSGYKEHGHFEDQQEARFGSAWAGLACLLLATGIVLGGIKITAGSLF